MQSPRCEIVLTHSTNLELTETLNISDVIGVSEFTGIAEPEK